ncbi:CBS domain-containing protein [Thalassobacillus pellis]|uniref:CBS domain-containing protein n=1 Tax=Thalassobacillus pellis TaxID=748008 RepID=UPI0019606246|nr:CBS domain-containing protein [Thalassobacillus pellis]MBM7552882.1 CBS domain-containing protein [Thalassobacillus pellis]
MKVVRDIMTDEVSCCSPEDHLFDAATLMKEKNVGAVPICNSNHELLGMVTDRDLVIRGYAEKKPGSTSIQEVMSEKLYHVSPDASLQEASDTMAEHKVRRLPVVDQGKLVGILALGDLSVEHMSDQAAGEALERISERPELH